MARHAAQNEQVRQNVDDVGRVELATDPDRQALPSELVDDVEHAELSAIGAATKSNRRLAIELREFRPRFARGH